MSFTQNAHLFYTSVSLTQSAQVYPKSLPLLIYGKSVVTQNAHLFYTLMSLTQSAQIFLVELA